MRRKGNTFQEMVAALHADPETAGWVKTKGEAVNKRELRRIWEKAGKNPVDALINEFNNLFMVVNENGKAVIYTPTDDPSRGRKFFNSVGFEDFRKLYMNRMVEVGRDEDDNPITKRVAEVWLNNAERRQFVRGIVFDPSGAPTSEGKLNLWQGFAVEPRKGTWDRLKDHIRTILGAGDPIQYEYLFGWMAKMFQYPAEQGQTSVVMCGIEGCGKGTLAKVLKRLLGQHAMAISQGKHLTGNFNAHLRDCLFLFADEAFFAGDKQHVGVLKAIITEDTLTIEGKFQNPVEVPNYLHLMMASNEEWVVPASLDARRFFVLMVSADRVGDYPYFEAIWEEMNNGGYEAMLYDLLNYDLSGFDVRKVPITEGLQVQKKLTLGTTESWWQDVLYRGYVYKSKHGLEHFGQWHDKISTELLFASYEEFVIRKRERHPLSRESLGRFMVKVGGKHCRLKDAVVGERMADVENQFGGTNRKPVLTKETRSWGYKIGNLELCRDSFCKETRISFDWPKEDLEDAA